jgi:hypothetical protein
MNKLSRGRSTHSDRLERWLGKDQVESISRDFSSFYHPVALHGVPGNVYVMPGGDFAGEILAGSYANKHDGAASALKKIRAAAAQRARRNKALYTLLDLISAGDRQMLSVGAFASIDAVIAAYTGGKGQQLVFQKTGSATSAAANSEDLWVAAGVPGAGAAGAAAPGGTAHTVANTGAIGFQNLGAANSGHYLNWMLTTTTASNSLLLYDRLFSVAKTMNSTATEAVTGTPSRYQNQTAGTIDYIGGNFCFPMNPTTVLPATAHNWTVCQYTNQGGTTGQSFPSVAGISAGTVGGIDLAAGAGSWFMALSAGDTGVKALTQMQCSALVATGTITFAIGHPIAINACPIANVACLDDGLYTALNLTPILDSACLTFLELPKPSTGAATYAGLLRTVSE